MNKFNLGNIVSWESASGGISKKKVGEIVEVIPANTPLATYYPQLAREVGKKKVHESYVVKVGSLYYWPKVNNLSFIQGIPAGSNIPVPPKAQVAPKQPAASSSSATPLTQQIAGGVKAKAPIVNIFGISLDKSSSMNGLRNKALEDYNSQVKTIRDASIAEGQTSYLTVVDSYQAGKIKIRPNQRIEDVTPDTSYEASGWDTPLFASTLQMIEALEKLPEASQPNVSFLVMVITDGGENSSGPYAQSKLTAKIKQLQATDRWTFVFRVPSGHKASITRALGLPEGNVLEWETTAKGLDSAAAVTYAATTNFVAARSAGQTKTASFYANINVDDATLKKTLTEITNQVLVYPVDQKAEIRPFVESKGHNYVPGNGYYELMKPETVQPYKDIMVQDKVDGRIYGGQDARNLLQLPATGNIRLKPGSTGHYDVFIQSTSVNRHLIPGTRMFYKR